MKKQTVAYTLGLFLGDYVVTRYLPTLSTDDIKTRNVIEVSRYDQVKSRELKDKWFASTEHMSKKYDKEVERQAWFEYRTYYIKMENKYLPKELDIIFRDIRLSDYTEDEQKEIIDGFITALWDCDCCTYSTKREDLVFISNEYVRATELTLKLDINKEVIFNR
jgi:hypothetical protein